MNADRADLLCIGVIRFVKVRNDGAVTTLCGLLQEILLTDFKEQLFFQILVDANVFSYQTSAHL